MNDAERIAVILDELLRRGVPKELVEAIERWLEEREKRWR